MLYVIDSKADIYYEVIGLRCPLKDECYISEGFITQAIFTYEREERVIVKKLDYIPMFIDLDMYSNEWANWYTEVINFFQSYNMTYDSEIIMDSNCIRSNLHCIREQLISKKLRLS